MKLLFARFGSDVRGAVVIVFALTFILMLTFVGLSIDYGNLIWVRSQMQVSADAAALAAASLEDVSDGERIAQANASFAANFLATGTMSSVFPNVTVADGKVTVTASGNVEASLLKVIEIYYVGVGVTSVALIATGFEPCFMSLDTGTSNAVYVGNYAEIRTEQCGAEVNSSANDAVVMDGGSWDAQMVKIVGNYVESGGTINASEGVYTNASSEADPYQLVDIPSFGGCSGGTNVVITSDTTLNPGVYCGGLTIQNGAQVTLSPGEYIINGGDLFMEEISEIEGNGVVIFITSSGAPSTIGSLRVTDHSQIDITSPTTGTYAGIAIYQDRDAPATGQNEILGVSSGSGPAPKIHVEGSIYLPSQLLVMNGDAELRIRVSSLCGKMVGKSFDLKDDALLRIDCDSGSSGSGPITARLIQ